MLYGTIFGVIKVSCTRQSIIMNTKNSWMQKLVVLLLALIASVAVSQPVYAQSNDAKGVGDSLKVSPLRTDLTIQPGDTAKATVYIQNLNPVPVTLHMISNDFIAGDKENGVPNIILDEDKYAPIHSLKRFMQTTRDFTVGPGERKGVDVVIKVPSSAQAGGYYGAIRFITADSAGNKNVNVKGSVASLLILTVPGNLVESLSLKEFSLQHNGKGFGHIVNSPDKVESVIRLENKGNLHLAPFGLVTVQKGKKTIYEAKINDTQPPGLVLPDSTRKFTTPVKNLSKFGKYKVIATLGYGENGQTITAERTFWVIPTTYIFGAIGTLFILIGMIVLVVSSLRSYKRRILRQARRRR